jgi:glycine cleavage system pyridoxal-binding protein P
MPVTALYVWHYKHEQHIKREKQLQTSVHAQVLLPMQECLVVYHGPKGLNIIAKYILLLQRWQMH